MKVELIYNFNEPYNIGGDTVDVCVNNYKYIVDVGGAQEKMSMGDLYDLYYLSALEEAAYYYINEYTN